MNKTLSLILHIVSVVLSIVLSITLLLSLLGTTLISVGRSYLTSEEFNAQIDNADLPLLTFTKDGEKLTLKEYAQSYAEEYIEKFIEENTKEPSFSLGDFSLSDIANSIKDIFNSEKIPIIGHAVDKFLNSEAIDKAIKNEIHSIIDYFLYSDPEEARERIENGITLKNNPAFSLENAETFEEKISIKIELFVLEFIEGITGRSTDEIIILLSEETAIKLKNISIGIAIALIVVNIRTIFNVLGYLGAVSLCFSGAINLIQNVFEKFHHGMQDLVSYKFIKPLMDCYSPYAKSASSLGIVLLFLFIISILIIIIVKKKKKVGDDARIVP